MNTRATHQRFLFGKLQIFLSALGVHFSCLLLSTVKQQFGEHRVWLGRWKKGPPRIQHSIHLKLLWIGHFAATVSPFCGDSRCAIRAYNGLWSHRRVSQVCKAIVKSSINLAGSDFQKKTCQPAWVLWNITYKNTILFHEEGPFLPWRSKLTLGRCLGPKNQLLASQTVFGTAGSGETNWSTTSCTSTTLFRRFFFISHHLQVKTSFPDSYPWTPRHLGFTHWDTSIAECWASCRQKGAKMLLGSHHPNWSVSNGSKNTDYQTIGV